MVDCMLRLRKMTRLPAAIAGTAQVAAWKYRDCRGCWDWSECGICRQRLPRLRKRMSAEVAGQHFKDCRDSQECLPRLPGLPILPAEKGWLHAEIEKNWRACRRELERLPPKMPRLSGCWERRIFNPRLPKVLTKVIEIATDIAGRHCRDCRNCWDCRECR